MRPLRPVRRARPRARLAPLPHRPHSHTCPDPTCVPAPTCAPFPHAPRAVPAHHGEGGVRPGRRGRQEARDGNGAGRVGSGAGRNGAGRSGNRRAGDGVAVPAARAGESGAPGGAGSPGEPGEYVPDPRRWKALTVCLIVGFMALLDVSIVNVALPSIEQGLGASESDLSWVVSGYALTFGLVLVPFRTAGRRARAACRLLRGARAVHRHLRGLRPGPESELGW